MTESTKGNLIRCKYCKEEFLITAPDSFLLRHYQRHIDSKSVGEYFERVE